MGFYGRVIWVQDPYTTASHSLDLLICLSSLFVVLMHVAGRVDARQF
jgi:hypothetical protein